MPDLSNRYASYSREKIYKKALESLFVYTSIRGIAETDPIVGEAYDLIFSEKSRNKVKQANLEAQYATLRDRRSSRN